METLKDILGKLSKEQIQNAIYELNLFTWPAELSIFKPVGWDFLTPDKRRKNELGIWPRTPSFSNARMTALRDFFARSISIFVVTSLNPGGMDGHE